MRRVSRGVLGLAASALFALPGTASAQDILAVPAPSNLSAEAVGTSRVDLSWTGASSPQVVEYRIYYADGTLLARVPDTQTTYSDTGLQPWTVYRYYVTAANGGGNESGPSNVATARTEDGTAPGSPQNLSGAPSGQGEITLTWSAASDPESGIAEYVVYRDDVETGRTENLTFVDGSLLDDQLYTYRVSAVNGQGLEGSPAGPIQVQTLADEAPDPPRDLTAVALGPDAVELNWRPPADDDDIDGYRVYRDGSPIATTTGTDFEDTGLAPFTTYQYTVTTLGEDGDESAPSNVAVVTTRDGTPPTVPRQLTATSVGSARIDLAWTPSEDPESGVQYYRVLRDGLEIATATATVFQDDGLEAGTSYEYRVAAVNGDGLESGLSDPASATTADGSGPTVPQDLVALPVGTDQIDLNWSPSTDDESGVALYRVFRDGFEIGTSTAPSYQDTGLTASTTYEYRVSAVNGEGLESELSDPASATTLDEPGPPAPVDLSATPVSTTNVELAWSAPAEAITGYNVYRDGTFVGSVTTTMFVDTGLAPGTTYSYQVASVVGDVQGERSVAVEATTFAEQDQTPPAPPTGLRLATP